MVKKDNRGRKKLDPEMKKIAVQVYITKIDVDRLGGLKQTKNKVLNFLKLKLHEKTFRNSQLEA